MGNCQAAEAATVVIQHPEGKLEKIYCSVSANQIMGSNPGHYVAMITTSVSAKSEQGTPVKQLKLLRPDDTLHIGHVYRLVSFEEVLKEFSGKRYSKLSKLISIQPQQKGSSSERRADDAIPSPEKSAEVKADAYSVASTRSASRHGQWRPALQSIDEVGR